MRIQQAPYHVKVPSPAQPQTHRPNDLAGVGGHLGLSSLGALLARDPRSSLGSVRGGLGLVGLLCRLGSGLLLLAGRDGGLAGSLTRLGALCAALFDHIERGADNGTLALDGTAGALLGDFL